jgi:hypothetical protein
MTEIFGINSSSNITVNSTGNPVPDPESLSTATIGLLAGELFKLSSECFNKV